REREPHHQHGGGDAHQDARGGHGHPGTLPTVTRSQAGDTGTVSSVDAVVFDLGGVLVDWDPRHLYRQLFDDEDEMERFLAEICSLEWHVAHDLGHDIEASCAELAGRHPEHADLIRAWADRSEDMVRGAIDGTVEI